MHGAGRLETFHVDSDWNRAACRAQLLLCLALPLALLVATSLHAQPEAVSPGAADRVAPMRDGCSAFSWSAVEGARGYELAVFALEDDHAATPDAAILRRRFPAAWSWSPAVDECLTPGRYGWVVRAQTAEGWSAWSEPKLFTVPDPASSSGLRCAAEDNPSERPAEPGVSRVDAEALRDVSLAPRSLTPMPSPALENLPGEASFTAVACQTGAEVFTDVPASSPYCGWIEQLYRDGITAGCGDGNFCPFGGVTRQQMAVFLERVLQARSPRQIDAGSNHNCVVQASGRLTCWGSNGFGQASPPEGTFQSVSAGHYHGCGVREDGMLACWGSNGVGESTPPAGAFQSVSAGESHSCGVNEFGFANCWGSNAYGQATPPGSFFVSVSAGGGHSCGVATDASVVCWGWNILGQSTPPAGTFQSVSAGLVHSCGVKSDATVACWGDDSGGQSTPPAGTFRSVSAGGYHTCAVKSDGALACWGRGEDGQSTPPTGTFVSVSTGFAHTCGVRGDGTVACWGANDAGQASPPGWL